MAGATHVLPRAWPRTTAWRRRSFRRAVTFYLLISPWLVGFILLGAVPLAGAFVMSFTNYDGLNLDYVRFVGTDNYARAFGDSDAQYALGRTLLLMAVVVPIGLALQLALALMVNQPIRFSNVFRTIFYLPYVIPVVAAVWIWKIFVDPTGGLVNAAAGAVFPEANWRLLVEYPTAVLAVLTIWGAAGGGMVVFLAGLQGIPAEYREAAMIDGASRAQVTRYITLPLLTPVIFFNLVTGIIVALQILVQPMLLSPGILGLNPGTVPPRDNYLYSVHASCGHSATNSLILSTAYAVLAVFVSALLGYGFARHRAPGHSKLFVLVIATSMVPNLVLFVPQFVLFARLGLTDTYWPWILWGLSGSPFAIFLFRQFFATFPRELDDAAEVDGAGPLRIFLQIYLPNAGPAIASSAVFMFLWVWGDWLYPALLLRQDNATLAVRMANAYVDPHGNPLQTVTMAGVVLYVLPLIVFFAFAQRYIVRGIVTTGIKG